MTIRVVDRFAGPGGWDQGMAMLGRRDVLGVEWDATAVATGRAAGHLRLHDDVSVIDPHEFSGTEGGIDSPPCQGFSPAGNGLGRMDFEMLLKGVGELAAGRDPRDWLRGSMNDPRSLLVLEPLRYALAIRPDWLAWEQVPPVLVLWQACAQVLRENGYSVWTGIVHAEQYGVPQTRRRAVLLASRHSAVDRPTPTHSRYYPREPQRLDQGVLPWVSMVQALGRGMTARPSMTVTAGGTGAGGDEPFGRGARNGMRREFDAGRWQLATGTRPNSTRRPLTDPAPTLAFGNDAASYIWVPEGVRQEEMPARKLADDLNGGEFRVTPTEAAVLQSFPADYPFRGTKTAQFRQVGDAIPPLLAAHVLAALGVGALRLEPTA